MQDRHFVYHLRIYRLLCIPFIYFLELDTFLLLYCFIVVLPQLNIKLENFCSFTGTGCHLASESKAILLLLSYCKKCYPNLKLCKQQTSPPDFKH
jgi:hypothetical protein